MRIHRVLAMVAVAVLLAGCEHAKLRPQLLKQLDTGVAALVNELPKVDHANSVRARPDPLEEDRLGHPFEPHHLQRRRQKVRGRAYRLVRLAQGIRDRHLRLQPGSALMVFALP